VLLLAGTVQALDPNKRLTQYTHTSWRIQDGSAPHGGYAITQTSDGFLWFISGDMMTFDGVRFNPWDGPPNYGSISTHDTGFGQIVNAFADHNGGLWVFGLRGIVHIRGRTVTSQFDLEGLRNLQSVTEDTDGSIWLVRGDNNVSDEPLCHVSDRALKCFGKADGIPISPIKSILADGKGGFWLGGQTALVHWHDGTAETYPIEGLKFNTGQPGIAAMARGPDGVLWVGIRTAGPGRGLGRLINGVFQPFVTRSFDGTKVPVHSMIFDRDGNLWVGTTGQGLFRIYGNRVDHYGRTEGLSSDTVDAVLEDREGILWAAEPGGIDKFRDPPVASFSSFEGLGNDRPMGVLANKDGTVWVANTGSLDHIQKNGAVSSIRAGSGLPGNQVAAMLEDSSGNMWVGVDDGLYLFKNDRFRGLPQRNHKPLGLVVGMAEDIDGNIWAECAGSPGKLVRIRDFEVREVFTLPQIPTGRTIAADPHGGIWIGTLNGDLALFRHGILKTFPLNAKGDPFIHQIIADADGSVLAGSADGLVGLRQGKVQRMTTKNGLPCNFVTSFIEDGEKRWWLYTDCGIVEFPDSELHRWWANPETIVQTHVYDEMDGAKAGRPEYNSAALSLDGRVWFASGVWVQMVDPSRVSLKAPHSTYIESVIVDRKESLATENLRFPPHPRDLQINYTSPTFLVPQKVKFRYRLDPYDRGWKDAGTRRQAFYTNLPPGKYSFRVIAANSDGVWNETAAKLDFSVAPAYYQTSWFRGLCAAGFLALVWAAYQWRVRQLQHQFDMTLEARVSERTRIARDLHDTLLQSAHGVLLRFQTVSQLLPERPVEAKEKLDNAIEQTADFITEARDEVQGLRDSTIQGNDLALAISTLGQELGTDSANHRPAFRVAVEGEARNLHPILRDEIYKIAAEALRNAFRHSQAQQIEAEIRYDTEQFRLRVRDDGKGVDPAILSSQGSGHFGLPGMRERATLIGGKLVVWSEVDAGTEVELRVPASAAYATAQRHSWFSRKVKA
jgi:signal transduction histidine kinase/ligand-binding sensor domain-containing protein